MKDITSNNETKQKPTYKDYQNFLQNYDEQQTKNGLVILSPASSSSSIQSAETDASMPKTYNEYLQSYGNRKFGSVRMKSEKVLEALQRFEDQIDGDLKKDLKKDLKNDVKKDLKEEKKIVRSELVININPPKEINKIKSPEIRTSPKPIDNIVPDHMIYAKSAVLEELLTNSPTLKKPINTTGNIYKRLEQFTLQNESNASIPTPSTKSSSITILPPKLPSTPPPNIIPSSTKSSSMMTLPPVPPPPPKTLSPSLPTSPIPGRIRVQLKKSVSNGPISPKPVSEMKPMVPQKNFLKQDGYIPPPPPQFNQFNHSSQNGENGQYYNKSKKMLSNTKTVVPVIDANAEVDKNDPNVKRLIYSTYRGMLGAYNNRANNMVSTLPRNFVVQDKGVSKQLESISAQGCLSNINGRVNPNPED